MAPPVKRKKIDKSPVSDPVSTAKFYCCRCGTAFSRQKGYFPVSHSPMYRGSGYLPWCSDCIEEMYENYRKKLGSDREAIKRMCMKMDLYWTDAIYDMVEKGSGVNSRIRNYIGKTNIIRYIDKTYDDTILDEAKAAEKAGFAEGLAVQPNAEQAAPVKEPEPVEEVSIPAEYIEAWGAGYTLDFYEELERRYHKYMDGVGSIDAATMTLYRQVALLETLIARDGAAGKPVDKNISQLNSLIGSLNLKPTQKKQDEQDAALDATPFGVWVKRWEDEEPVPEPDDDFKDVDGIVRYISIWFLGHLCKMLGIRNTYCKLYEDEMNRMRIERPEYEDEDDDETLFNDIFSDSGPAE